MQNAEKQYRVVFVKDDEANVWVATSEDVPGLVLESESIDRLMEKVSYAIPELLDADEDGPVHIQHAGFEQVYM